jgi:hypothetical protein
MTSSRCPLEKQWLPLSTTILPCSQITKIGAAADGTSSLAPCVSSNGQYVAFQSNLDNLDFYDTNQAVDVLLYNGTTGLTVRVSASPSGVDQPYQASTEASISGDAQKDHPLLKAMKEQFAAFQISQLDQKGYC